MKKIHYQTHLFCLVNEHTEIAQRPINGQLSALPQGGFKFEQTCPEKSQARNPRLYEGEYINIGRNKEGELLINFRRTKLRDKAINIATFSEGVYQELMRELPVIASLGLMGYE